MHRGARCTEVRELKCCHKSVLQRQGTAVCWPASSMEKTRLDHDQMELPNRAKRALDMPKESWYTLSGLWVGRLARKSDTQARSMTGTLRRNCHILPYSKEFVLERQARNHAEQEREIDPRESKGVGASALAQKETKARAVTRQRGKPS